MFESGEVQAENWIIEWIDRENHQAYSSIALDSKDIPHISYFDSDKDGLQYAKWTGIEWKIEEVVDTNTRVPHGISMALDSTDRPHISYSVSSSYDLEYVRWTGTEWAFEKIDYNGSVGGFTSLELDSNGYPNIAYYDSTNKDLKFAKYNGINWSTEIVYSVGEVGEYCSLVLDDNDNAHISFYSDTSSALVYAKWNGTGWDVELIDSENMAGEYTSIDLDSLERPHISYNGRIGGDNTLKHAFWNGTGWEIEIVDGLSNWVEYSSIAVDSIDSLHISYSYKYDEKLMYAKYNGIEWSIKEIDAGGRQTSIAVDSSDYPHISYGSGSRLKYSSCSPSANKKPPSRPNYLYGHFWTDTVHLSWDTPYNSGGSPITQYKVYRGQTLDKIKLLTTIDYPDRGYDDSDVVPKQTYYYYVTAVNTYGESLKSDIFSITLYTKPSPPTNLTATADDELVLLEWDPPLDDGGTEIIEYRIYLRGYLRKTISGTYTSYYDWDVENGKSYEYTVTAKNKVGESDASIEVSAKPGKPVLPRRDFSPPRNLTADAGDGYVNLTWDEPEESGRGQILYYRVYVSERDNFWFTYPVNIPPETKYFNDTSVQNFNMYEYFVKAFNEAGGSEVSKKVHATPGYRPLPPLNLSAVLEDNIVILTWEQAEYRSSDYNIYRGTTTDPGGFERINDRHHSDIEDFKYADDRVPGDNRYYYYVTEHGSYGESDPSNIVTITVGDLPDNPKIEEVIEGEGYIEFHWQPVARQLTFPIQEYRIYKRTGSENLTLLTTLDNNITSYKDNKVIGGQRYFYCIRSVNEVGESVPTIVFTAVPKALPKTEEKDGGSGEKDELSSGSFIRFLFEIIIIVILLIVLIAAIHIYYRQRDRAARGSQLQTYAGIQQSPPPVYPQPIKPPPEQTPPVHHPGTGDQQHPPPIQKSTPNVQYTKPVTQQVRTDYHQEHIGRNNQGE